MRLVRFAPVLCLAALAACRSTLDYRQNAGWATPAVYTTADTRMIIQRPHPLGQAGRTVVCTEPSPDVAKALSTASELQLSGGNGAANGSLGGGSASAEAVAELAGRSTALLGLRDGLYRTCEAYANGAVGDLAYALVLSRYGQLMATLFLGQDVLESGAPARAQSPDLSPPPATGGTQPPPAAAPKPPPAAPGATTSTIGADRWPGLLRQAAWPFATPALGATPPAAQDAQKQPPAQRAAPRVVAPTTVQAAPSGAPSGVVAGNAGAPAALAQMQAAYLDLDAPERLLNVLLVACINAEDPTRPARAAGEDPMLSALCRQFPALLAARMTAASQGPASHAATRAPRHGAGR